MKITYFTVTARATTSTLFFLTGVIFVALALFAPRLRSASPASGAITTAGPTLAWDGTAVATASASGESTCVETVNCDSFLITVGGTTADWGTAAQRIEVKIAPPASVDDFDLVIHKGSNASGAIVDSSGNGAGAPEVAHISPATDGVGAFTVHVIYFATAPTDQYHGTAAVVPLVPTPPPAAVLDNGPKIGYENFEVPPALTQVSTTTGVTVEYMGRNAGEPSIGNNWNTGVTNFQSDLETLFVTFADGCAAPKPASTWINRRAPTSQVIDSDPIGFTDRTTGRTFAAELSATSPTCKISYTDDDGVTWIPSPGTLGSGIDHETIGGGPYHAPLVGTPAYPNAVYYCSQDLVTAFCLRSDDGGATWGPPVDTYTTECGGLHGHVKVSPKDGSVFLPNNDCGGDGAVVVSEDNGITWHIRHVSNGTTKTTSGASDPAVAIDNNGRAYFSMANADASAAVAFSDDNGSTWNNIVNVSDALGLKNIRYPAAVAGDKNRAAIAFYGTTTGGSANAGTFNGLWHLYVAHTFDGGLTWTTSDATPTAPVQRGCIWTGGGANICRNMLDFFDATIDKEGRVLIGYVNGCAGGNCAQAPATAKGNAYGAVATMARQSSGRRLIAASDPTGATAAPGMPSATVIRLDSVVHLAWSEGDTGNSPITNYRILRGTASGAEDATPIATVPGTQTSYDDTSATDATKTYYYKVIAENAVGASCPNNEIAAPFAGSTCDGLLIHQNDPSHPESAAAGLNPQLAIDYIAAGEPVGTSDLMFKVKVADLSTVPPNSRWRIVWDSFASPGQQYYVGMNSDASGATTFVHGTVATAVVGLVVGVPQETEDGPALPTSNFKPDGTITIFVPKSAVGNPQPGDLLGAVNGRTFGDNTNVERSTSLVDHTFVKAQTDNSYPPATYTVVGNVACSAAGPTPTPVPGSQLLNISSRLRVQTGDSVLIGGFIITGTVPKKVIVRALGSSLRSGGAPLPGRLANPTLELHDQSAVIGSNDDWKSTQQAEIENSGLAPSDDLESAIVLTLNPGNYTAVVRGKDSTTGIGVVDVFDVSQAGSKLANISTRGFVETGDNVLIGGFILGPIQNNAANVVIRALGPSLASSGVPNPLQDPTLEVHDGNGTTFASNDNWATDPNAVRIASNQLAPSDPNESATFQTLIPGAYTVIVRGANGGTGVGLVEVYNVP